MEIAAGESGRAADALRRDPGEVDRTGRFSRETLPGDFLVAAVSSVPDNWMAPDFLEKLLPLAVPAKLAIGETTTVSVRVQDVRP